MPKYTVEFPPEVNTMLEALAKKEHTNKREILRRALALYNYVHKQGVGDGERKVSVTDQNDQVIADVLF